MRKWLKILGVGSLVALAGMQFFPVGRNASGHIPPEDFIKTMKPPLQIAGLLENACYDCHSNNTRYPWYGTFQPAAWLMEKHITAGKAELNFNEFGTYSGRKQKSKLKAMISQIENDGMPLWSYTILHADARLSGDEKKNVTGFLDSLRENL